MRALCRGTTISSLRRGALVLSATGYRIDPKRLLGTGAWRRPMSRNANGRASSLEDVRTNLVGRLRVRQPEIEAAIFAHVRGMYGSIGKEDAEYQAGLGWARRSPRSWTMP
jgi:hypothetical protein